MYHFSVADIGGDSVEIVYVSGNGTNILHFEYIIEGQDLDEDGIHIIFLLLNGASLNYVSGSIYKRCNSTSPPFS